MNERKNTRLGKVFSTLRDQSTILFLNSGVCSTVHPQESFLIQIRNKLTNWAPQTLSFEPQPLFHAHSVFSPDRGVFPRMTRISGYSHDSVTFPMVREENPGDNLTGCGVLFPEMFKVEKTMLGCLKRVYLFQGRLCCMVLLIISVCFIVFSKTVIILVCDHFSVYKIFQPAAGKNKFDHFGVWSF